MLSASANCILMLTRVSPQDDFRPGLTRAGVARQLATAHGADGRRTFRGRDLSGWYLQQVMLLMRCNLVTAAVDCKI